MPIFGLIFIGGLIYVAYTSGALAPFGIAPPSANAVIPGSVIAGQPAGGLQPNTSITAGTIPSVGAGATTQANTTGLAITGAASVGSAAAAAPSSFAALGLTGAAAGAALAGIGVVAGIAAALWAAHEQRVKQAQSENAAVNLGVAGWDSALRQVNAAYNARQLAASDAISLVQQIMQMYWQEVTPHIQPGRNGCNGGAGCPPWPASGNGCSGSIGAACCVGCYDLIGGTAPVRFTAAQGGDGVTAFYFGIQGTIIVLQQGGGRVLYQEVFGSKYGGKDRPAYILNWQQVSAA